MCRDDETKTSTVPIRAAAAVKRKTDYLKYHSYNCSECGHIARHCKTNSSTENSDEVANDEFMVRVATVSSRNQHVGFVISSGAPKHILNNPDGFLSLEEIDPSTVQLAGGTKRFASKENVVWLDIVADIKQFKRKQYLC